jgi:GNAT superfamily N-acetyltransferase
MNQTLIEETKEILLAKTEEQISSCYEVMRQLRPHLEDCQKFTEQVQRQIKEGYILAYLQEEGSVRSLAGFRFLEFLAWGRVLYIDDLISDSMARKNGHGSTILKWVIQQAREAKCDQVHLDSGPQRHEAHRLYLNHGFKIIGHHFALDFKDPSIQKTRQHSHAK